MADSAWQRRIARARELARQHPFAAEILGFYVHIAHFQENLFGALRSVLQLPARPIDGGLNEAELGELNSRFEPFLCLIKAQGPQRMRLLSQELGCRDRGYWRELLDGSWQTRSPSDAQGFLAWAFLQPYAELRRSGSSRSAQRPGRALCPCCNRRPAIGILRQMGDGGARSLSCCFCVAEGGFRRIVCPGCGEESDQKLPVFNAADFDYIRLECCDSCKTYLKTIDLTTNGHAEPLVDDLASAPLDLWARDRGYARLQPNFFGM